GLGIAVDDEGSAYVTGVASGQGFPVTPNAFQQTDGGGFLGDGFVARINPQGDGLVYCTYLCGTGHDSANAIALDPQRNAIVVGRTASHDFPTTNAFQAIHPGGAAAETSFVSKLDPTGSHLVYSTYLGGTVWDVAAGIAVDAAGNAYVTGETAGGDFPTTPGVIQAAAPFPLCFGGVCSDGFVAKFRPEGSLAFSTLLAGEGDDAGIGIAVSATGEIYVTGTTASLYFPIRRAFQSRNHGNGDAFVTVFNSNATRIVFSSFLGGGRPPNSTSLTEGAEYGGGIALAPGGKVYLSGRTISFNFPVTPGAQQTNEAAGDCFLTFEPCGDSFLTGVTLDGPVLVPTPHLAVAPVELAPGDLFTATWDGISAPTSNDLLVLYGLGERSDSFIFLPTYETMELAEGSLPLALPETLASGSYELRLLIPDPEALPLLKTAARSEPLIVLPAIKLVPVLEGGNLLRVHIQGLRAGPYRVEASESAHSWDWQTLTNGLGESGQTAEFLESMDSGHSRRFYRVSQ
ncbi:MAG TPA: SBBP repeat-containing protein, partial [Verrucomicrobiae bacterium]|nr:SBBP repeat-containing protein [Verrucomicrobiae bacterium]